MVRDSNMPRRDRGHPYLFFSAEDLRNLRERIERPPFRQKWLRLLQNADGYLCQPPPKVSGEMGMRVSRPSLGLAGTTAFAYVITEDRKYAERAKQEAMAMLQAGRWVEGKHKEIVRGADLATGEASVACALVYDWCFDTLDPAERRAFGDDLTRLSIGAYLESVQANDWWVSNYVTNWCGVCHGGCGLAALALYDESPQAKEAANHAWKHLSRFLRDVNHEDGGGDEGVSYYTYGAVFGHYFASAYRRVLGDDQGLYRDLTPRLAGYWTMYMLAPDGNFANFNDMNEKEMGGFGRGEDEGGMNGALCALFEADVPGGDRLLLWGADQGGARSYWKGGNPFYFIWRRDAAPATAKPRLDDAALFRGSGHAVLQSPRLWFAFNGGWISDKSHCNLDLGTFILLADGERLVNDWGRQRHATGDHSTILVNGKGQKRGARARYRRFGSAQGFHYLACDLSQCYEEALIRFVRHAVVVDGSYLVLLDDVAAKEPAEFEWRLQSRCTTTVDAPSSTALIQGNRMTLHVLAAAPSDALMAASTQRGNLGLADLMHTTTIRPAAARREETIVAALYPTPHGERAPVAEFSSDGVFTVVRAGKRDTIVFERGNAGWELKSVNDEDASAVGTCRERTLTAFRPAQA